jgi:mycothiol system anti-sigma-R factor
LNCKQALKLLYDVIDREASRIETARLEKHLKNCRPCLAVYEFERMFQTLIVSKSQNIEDSTVLKDKIRAQLDAIDAAGQVDPSRL